MDVNIMLEQAHIDVNNFIDQLPGYLLIKDVNFRFTVVGNKTAQLFGFRNLDAMLGKMDYDLKCGACQCADDFQQQDRVAYNNNNNEDLKFIGYYHYADEYKITLNSKNIVFNKQGEAIGVSCYITDITNYNLIDFSFILMKSDVKFYSKNCLNQFTYFLSDSYFDEELTSRQAQCLFFLLRGKSVKTIAKILDLSHRTVETHVESIKIRFNCQNKSELIEKAWEKGYMNILPKSFLENEMLAKLKQL